MDLERAYMLLLLVKEAQLHGSMYKIIIDKAGAELKTIVEELEKDVKPKPAPKGYLEQQMDKSKPEVRKI